MSIGENIRKRRLELNLSQQEVADALGLKTRSSVAKIEKNTANISQDKLLTLANFLNTTIEYLLTGTSDELKPYSENINFSNTISLSNNYKCIAIILAGGKYRVNKHNIPYQFVSVKEKPIIIYTMEAYQRHPLIEEIYVVCLDGWEDFLPAYAEEYGISKLKGIIPAGEHGIQSVKNAIEWLSRKCSSNDIIVLQESTRPLVDSETISSIIRNCKKYKSAVSYTHLEDTTPFLMSRDKKRVTPVDAYSLITIQSPEAYNFGMLQQAFKEASKINHEFSEAQCSIFMHNLGWDLSFCEGNHSNIRIIYEEDIKLFEALL